MTLIEVSIVLVMVSALLAISAPSFARLLSEHRATSAANDFMHAAALARSEAMRRGQRVYVAPFNGRWSEGWAVFVDHDDDRRYDDVVSTRDELIHRHAALPSTIAVVNTSGSSREPFTDVGAPPRPYVMFTGGGWPRQRNGGLGIGGIALVDRTGGALSIRSVCLSAYGRARLVRDFATCVGH